MHVKKYLYLLFISASILFSAMALALESKTDDSVIAPAAVGGPDTFGYRYTDSNEAGSPAYNFIDISSTGTQVFLNVDDSSSGPITLGAAFPFYGTNYTQLVMASNGYISTLLSDTGPDLSNDCPIPAVPSSGGGGRIYILHDDLISTGYYQYFSVCPYAHSGLGCSIFMWSNATHFGGGGPWDMEAILFDNGDILYQYGPGNPEQGSGSTTGVMNPAYTTALQYGTCNSAGSITDNLAILIYNDDGDGVAAAIEDAVNPSGDGNNDGTRDSLQSNVTSLPSATGKGYITVEIVGCNLQDVVAVTENPDDLLFSYPFGLVGFALPDCPSARVIVYYHGTSQLTTHEYRKYGPLSPAFGAPEWYTMPDVTFGTATVEGPSGTPVTVATASFGLVDGGVGDDTDANDGNIVDQGGPGLPPLTAATVPTLTEWGMILFMLFAGAGSVFYLRRLKQTQR